MFIGKHFAGFTVSHLHFFSGHFREIQRLENFQTVFE